MLEYLLIIPAIGIGSAVVKGIAEACAETSKTLYSGPSRSSSSSSDAAEARRRNRQKLVEETVQSVCERVDETIAASAEDFQALKDVLTEAASVSGTGALSGAKLSRLLTSMSMPENESELIRTEIRQRLFQTTSVDADALDAAKQWLQDNPDGLWKIIGEKPQENLNRWQRDVEKEVNNLEQLIHTWQSNIGKELP